MRRDEGKAVGLEAVEMVLLEVSVKYELVFGQANVGISFPDIPLFCAPQTSQVR